MPTISRFYGILIRMYHEDHAPPHFHAVYADFEAAIGIVDLEVLRGEMPSRALGLIREWARMHRRELLADWDLAERQQPLLSIDPLD